MPTVIKSRRPFPVVVVLQVAGMRVHVLDERGVSATTANIVPAIVGKTDSTSPISHTRGMIKAATARSITEPGHRGGLASYDEMQKRAFFRDMFIQARDVIPDLCARKI